MVQCCVGEGFELGYKIAALSYYVETTRSRVMN